MATNVMHLAKFGRIGNHINSNAFARTFATTIKSDGQRFITLDVDANTGIATMALNRPPVNALNAAFMNEIQRSIKDLEQSKCRFLILTSALERIFSAGLDLKECYKPDTASLEAFWVALQNLWRTLFSTSLTTVALVNGHSLAGGCMMAISSDYRIMLPNFKIGLNDTMAGLAVPMWLMETYANAVPSRRIAERDLTTSRIYNSDEALKAGLVDELAVNKEQAHAQGVAFIKGFEKCSPAARNLTKQMFRAQILKNFEKTRQHDLEIFMTTVLKSDFQAYLGEYLESLKTKKAKA